MVTKNLSNDLRPADFIELYENYVGVADVAAESHSTTLLEHQFAYI